MEWTPTPSIVPWAPTRNGVPNMRLASTAASNPFRPIQLDSRQTIYSRNGISMPTKIEAGSNLLMGLDPARHDNLETEITIQSEEYNRLASAFSKAMALVVQAPVAANPAGGNNPLEPKIKKELAPDTLTKDTNPIEFRRFLRDFRVYYKESYMERASIEGQRHYLLRCMDAELSERLISITTLQSPIFDDAGNNNKSCVAILEEEFGRRFPITNRRKDFFMQSQGGGSFTAYIDKLRRMASEADLGNTSVEDLIVVMSIVGCRDDLLRGDLQKLATPTLLEICEIGEAHERKIFAEQGHSVKVSLAGQSSRTPAPPSSQQRPANKPDSKPQRKPPTADQAARRRDIERLMQGKCYRCGESHKTESCSHTFKSLKCSKCERQGHISKACYSEMLKKQSTPIATQVVHTTLQASQAINASGSQFNNLDEPPKPIPPMWL